AAAAYAAAPAVVRDADLDVAAADAAAIVERVEGDAIGAPVARAAALDAHQRHLGAEPAGVGAGVAAAGIEHGLVLRDRDHVDGDRILLGVGHAEDVHRFQAMVRRP